jgi:hypothetical protein
MKRLRGQLTYANVISTLCLFLLLGGGTAFAAAHLAKNSVGTKQIKNNAITAAKIANGAVGGAKIDLSTIGTVPNATHAGSADTATHAGSADTADHAASADTADHAGSATNADHAASASAADHAASADSATTAESASDANLLGGISSQGFASSSRFAFGSASTDGGQTTLFTLGGIEVTTVADAADTFDVQIKNLTPQNWEFGTTANSSAISVNANGDPVVINIPTARAALIQGIDLADPSKAITIQCGSDNGPDFLYCFGQISPNA